MFTVISKNKPKLKMITCNFQQLKDFIIIAGTSKTQSIALPYFINRVGLSASLQLPHFPEWQGQS